MHREAAGMAKWVPKMIREAIDDHESIEWALREKMKDVQISHHTGAQLIAFPFHTMELTNMFRQPRPVQNMYRHVPVFQASRCQGKGTTQARKPRNANVEKTGLGIGPGAEDISKITAPKKLGKEGGGKKLQRILSSPTSL
jgi:hypothetical protein